MQNKIQNKKVLVTGGAGFIGANIVETLLKQDNEVICLDNFITGKKENISRFLDNSSFRLIEGDIRDKEICAGAVKDVDIVLHQAALGSVPRSVKDPVTTNDINIGGFLNMLIAAKDEGIKRFVYASSSSVYGDNNDLPKIENKTGNPLSPYALTKKVNEYYAGIFSDLYGIQTIGLRYFNVFGKYQDPKGPYAAVIPKFIMLLLKGESPVINGDGEQTRDFTYVDNVVMANQIAALTDNPDAVNTVYNVAFGVNTSINELYNILKEYLTSFNKNTSDLLPQYGPEQPGDVRHSMASVEKAVKLLGYDPQYSLKEGLKIAIEWYVNNLS